MVTPKSRRRGCSGMELLLQREWIRSATWFPAAYLGLRPHHKGEKRQRTVGPRGAMTLPALSPDQRIVEGLAEQGEDGAQNGGGAEEERCEHQQHIDAEQRPNQSRHGALATGATRRHRAAERGPRH